MSDYQPKGWLYAGKVISWAAGDVFSGQYCQFICALRFNNTFARIKTE
jgi:hypothetical protein